MALAVVRDARNGQRPLEQPPTPGAEADELIAVERVEQPRVVAPIASMTEPLDAFLDRLAAGTPAPGGGAAAALTGALAAALLAMAGRVTGRHGDDPGVTGLVSAADEERHALRRLAARDEEAYRALVGTRRGGHGDAALGEAMRMATTVPLDIARASLRVLEIAGGLARVARRSVASDVGVAADLAGAALAAGIRTARANLDGVPDRAEAARMEAELGTLAARGDRVRNDVREALARG